MQIHWEQEHIKEFPASKERVTSIYRPVVWAEPSSAAETLSVGLTHTPPDHSVSLLPRPGSDAIILYTVQFRLYLLPS